MNLGTLLLAVWLTVVLPAATWGQLCGSVPEPDASCRLAAPDGAGKSSVEIKELLDNSKDSFKWKWSKGQTTDIVNFGAPNSATYHVCIYDGSGATQPLLDADIPNAQACTTCWRSTPTGFKYKNKTGMPAGITRVTLKAGTIGSAQVQIKGKGPLLGPPATADLVTDVVVQLLVDDGGALDCFKTSFPGTSGQGAVTKQTSAQFKAKGP